MNELVTLYQLSDGAVRLSDDAVLAEYDLPVEGLLALNTGTLAESLANLTSVATGTLDIAGVLARTLDDATLDGEGVHGVPIEGTLSRTLDDVAIDTTGAVQVAGALVGQLAPVGLTATGQLELPGRLDRTLGAVLLDANGAVTTPPTPTGLPIAAPDRPALAVEWLLDVGAFHLGTRDLVLAGVTYSRGIVRGPTVERHLDQVFYGFQEISRVTLDLANPTGALDPLWSTEHRGVAVTLRRYDRRRNVAISEFSGVVEQVELEPGRVLLNCVNLDLSVLDTLVPRTLVTAERYGSAVCPDAGRPEYKVLGTCEKVPLVYVRDDVPAGVFWYLISLGTGYTVTAIYRDRIGEQQYQQLDPSEYSVSGAAVAGRTIVGTVVRQLKAGGGFHRLFADITGPAAERNFARAARNLLSDTTWGLGQTVNATSFNAAEAALPPQLLCDGVLNEQRPARDWLQPMLSVRGMRPGYSSTGWTLAVDTPPTTAAMKVRDAPGVGERTMLRPGRRMRPTLDEQVSTYRLRFRPDLPTATFQLSAADRVVSTLGKPKEEEHPLIRDRVTADMVACYRAKRLQYNADQLASVAVTEEGRALVEGQVVNVSSPRLLANDVEFQVAGVSKRSGEQILELLGWNPDIYVYSPLALPTVPTQNASVIPPGVPSFTIAGSGVDMATEPGRTGQVSSWVSFAVTIPNTPTVDAVRLDLRKTGATAYGDAQTVNGAPGATVAVRVGNLVPAVRYDFRAVALSGPNESTPATITNVLAPGDTTAPAIPTFVLDATRVTAFTLRVTSARADDFKSYEYEVRTSASAADAAGVGTIVKSGTFDGTLTLTNADIGYRTARHVRIREKDTSGNPTLADGAGARWTATQSFTFTEAVTTDLGDNAVVARNIAPQAVEGPKRFPVSLALFDYSMPAPPEGAGANVANILCNTGGQTTYNVASGHLQVVASLAWQSAGQVVVVLLNLSGGAVSEQCAITFEPGLSGPSSGP